LLHSVSNIYIFNFFDQEEEDIGSAISHMIEGQSYINRKERHLRLMEKALQNNGIDPVSKVKGCKVFQIQVNLNNNGR